MSQDALDARRKRLLYRSNYRGFKEADLLLGGFAKAYAAELSEAELTELEDLMEAKDHDIYDWISGKVPVPANYDTGILARLRNFDPVEHLKG